MGQGEHICVKYRFIWVKHRRRHNKMLAVVVSGWWFW